MSFWELKIFISSSLSPSLQQRDRSDSKARSTDASCTPVAIFPFACARISYGRAQPLVTSRVRLHVVYVTWRRNTRWTRWPRPPVPIGMAPTISEWSWRMRKVRRPWGARPPWIRISHHHHVWCTPEPFQTDVAFKKFSTTSQDLEK